MIPARLAHHTQLTTRAPTNVDQHLIVASDLTVSMAIVAYSDSRLKGYLLTIRLPD